jgi:hypothetical protein
MKFAVINPRGNDPEQHFPDGAGAPDEAAHPPVNYHAFAACMNGGFYRKESAIPPDVKAVVVLVRRDLTAVRQALIDLRRAGKTVAIAFKEAGAFQIAALLAKPANVRLFHEICERADGAIATTPDLMPFFRATGVRYAEFIPTPYPLADVRWDFGTPIEERRGIFVGTREFDIPSRNHLAALLVLKTLAESMGEPVTVFNVDGWSGRRMLASLGYPDGMLRVIEGRRPYPRYLRGVAKHKLIFQLDASAVPGQVAGDALLCRVPCIGGNGTTERFAFPDLCGHGRTTEQLFDIAARLLEHPHDVTAVMERALSDASESLSYAVVAEQLERFFTQIGR